MSNTVYIVAAKRTPIGSFQGSLSLVAAPHLGAHAIKSALSSIELNPNEIDECIMGEVLTAGVGQAPARQAAIYAGLPLKTPCLTINKVCGSGLKAVMLGADSIRLGHSLAVVAGGQENMTLAPHLMENSRNGFRMGPVTMSDSMVKDGLWDPYKQHHMGQAAELCVKKFEFTREEQDEFAAESYRRATRAQTEGLFKNELSPITVTAGKKEINVSVDEEPGKVMFDKIPQLKPAFDKAGTITAANASKINDGGAALILMSEEKMKKSGLKPIAKIVSYATFAGEPDWFTTAPIGAIQSALKMANLTANDIHHFEINEAFANVAMAAKKELKIDSQKLNPFGGAVALGHPIGASGARILTTLVHGLKNKNEKYGLASLCIGGGEAVAMVVENIKS
jgi:acetyl-CoA C-acetyltransferase